MKNGHTFQAIGEISTPALVMRDPLHGARAAVPIEVKRDGDMLLWRRDETNARFPLEGFREGAPVDQTIWKFVELRDAEPDAFVDFAMQFGVLGIRTDGLPGTAPLRDHAVNMLPPVHTENGVTWHRESIEVWRMYAVSLRTVLAFATELQRNPAVPLDSVIRSYDLGKYSWESFNLPRSTDDDSGISGAFRVWATLLNPGTLLYNLAQTGPDHARAWLSNFISWFWIDYAGLKPIISWEDGATRMTLSLGRHFGAMLPNNFLFSVLAAQLTALVTSEEFERVDQCIVCGKLFVKAIKPGRHARAYCEDHKIEGERERKRRWARKVAAERKAKQSE